MKSNEEITKKAREICQRNDAECALFITGFVAGYRAAEKELSNEEETKDE